MAHGMKVKVHRNRTCSSLYGSAGVCATPQRAETQLARATAQLLGETPTVLLSVCKLANWDEEYETSHRVQITIPAHCADFRGGLAVNIHGV